MPDMLATSQFPADRRHILQTVHHARRNRRQLFRRAEDPCRKLTSELYPLCLGGVVRVDGCPIREGLGWMERCLAIPQTPCYTKDAPSRRHFLVYLAHLSVASYNLLIAE
jgi:hypothetical protein